MRYSASVVLCQPIRKAAYKYLDHRAGLFSLETFTARPPSLCLRCLYCPSPLFVIQYGRLDQEQRRLC
ncbi:hypothetical protein L210DRAFT_3539458 [Boletus edulis BED1]|uniref:Uncharacterized protein n=1 Tax=Boletus edulis BED1 TaxID=1328754 RepID=A0AAD4BUY3_BOLED|nr:hypothetical protein L210DRAFT_3539458 [Boletus edulis BED1]